MGREDTFWRYEQLKKKLGFVSLGCSKNLVDTEMMVGIMEKAGYENFIELGPNKVLTGLVKKTLKGKNAVNIENNATMEKALASLS